MPDATWIYLIGAVVAVAAVWPIVRLLKTFRDEDIGIETSPRRVEEEQAREDALARDKKAERSSN